VEEGKKYKVEEPTPEYRRITFFNSFDEAELHGLKEMASHTYEQRLSNLEQMRKQSFHLTGNSRLARIVTITLGSE
jgi:hypothetical protein